MNEVNFIYGTLILAIVNVLTTNFYMPKKFSPLVAVVLGIATGVIYVFPGDWKTGVLFGVAEGLGAVGFYSATKNTIQGLAPAKQQDSTDYLSVEK